MTTLTEGTHAGEFLVSEGNGWQSRDSIVVISGQNLAAGAVLGQITASKKYTLHNSSASDGSEAAIAILFEAVDASAGDANGVGIARLAEVNGDEITWKSGISVANKTAGIESLKAAGIIVR